MGLPQNGTVCGHIRVSFRLRMGIAFGGYVKSFNVLGTYYLTSPNTSMSHGVRGRDQK